jgi:hypothetical protein
MMTDDRAAIANRLMSEFAARTGLSPPGQQQRYLWTDAFAVCNFLELFARSGDQDYRCRAIDLIDRVHRVLGRFRHDDTRVGWISGLDEERGRQHPTAGGLRIGKRLREREAHEPVDERLEWDRDGQYFHYLTKWMHALCRTGLVSGDPDYSRWAAELAQEAFKAFVRRSRTGEVLGVYWKMSTDLSRPLVAATGRHDALDALISFREVQYATAKLSAKPPSDLSASIAELAILCQDKDWTTDDPLGLGGLLFDACRLSQLMREERQDVRLLERLTDSCRNGLVLLLAQRQLQQPAWHRLPFRELGLSIGLQATPIIAEHTSGFRTSSALQESVRLLASYAPVGEEIVAFWLPESQRQHKIWRDHQDINDVMLATALIPDTFLRAAVYL